MLLFYNGRLVKKIADVPSDPCKAIVEVVRCYNADDSITVGMELYADCKDLEVPVTEIYRIGEPVRSLGSFTGKVVGYEYCTNRPIVVSDKVDRYKEGNTRYVYDTDKLIPIVHSIHFEPGKYYMINNQTPVMAVRDPEDRETIMLVSKKGNIIYKDLAEVNVASGLALNNGIETVKQIKSFND